MAFNVHLVYKSLENLPCLKKKYPLVKFKYTRVSEIYLFGNIRTLAPTRKILMNKSFYKGSVLLDTFLLNIARGMRSRLISCMTKNCPKEVGSRDDILGDIYFINLTTESRQALTFSEHPPVTTICNEM